ncbi:hypothetical protein [Streptomyces sp. G-G2]|uniref:hypothetical protein n=1 Tax=Streptomyces sp. G-G2 TaxID=3046201 RepID=UPI0024B969AC|nr:hypothetical protein [Streptomyces sp. G-G2]MDJ0381807.1 hypothetical protein [Streptomyces sp. G-G2]
METASSTAIAQLAAFLRGLTALLDPRAGWYGEFLSRDPEGVRACLDGVAIVPWDVLESLLQDLARLQGPELAAVRSEEAARLRRAAALAHDRMPGGEEELHGLLAAAGVQRDAAGSAVQALTARLSAEADPAVAAALSGELSWTRDDLARATSRRADLAARLDGLAQPLPAVPSLWPPEPGPEQSGVRRRRGGRGARFAGAAVDPGEPVFAPPPGADPGAGAQAPRGARYGPPATPAARRAHLREVPAPTPTVAPAPGPRAVAGAAPGAEKPAPDGAAARGADGEAVPALVGELIVLRGQGRTGEAHALLCAAAGWDAGLLPGLARELERAALAADWAALLWEAASLPPDRLAALAAALGDAGRPADRDRLLRQGAGRPAPEIADAALALGAAGRVHEAEALLAAFVSVRGAEEAARLARRNPQWFAPRLLRAARGLPGRAHRDLVHAFRVAGIPTP